MKKRIITALIITVILLPIVVINDPTVFTVFQWTMALFVIIASHEMISMFETEKKYSIYVKIVIISLALLMFLNVGRFWDNPSHALPGFNLINLKINNVAIIAFMVIILFSLFIFEEEFTASDMGKVFIVINYVGLGAAAVTILRFLGVRFIVYVALIGMTTDIFAYFVGLKFGKRKMAPKISPKKTWEGAIGGTVIATILGSCFALFYGVIFTPDGFLGDIFNAEGYRTIFDKFTSLGNEPWWLQALIVVPITLLGSVSAQIGDLVASKFKRTYDIKDFGSILPGHGGLLDRFDSTIFISILFVGIFLTLVTIFPIAT